MLLARVIGNVVATKKDAAMQGRKLLLLQPVNGDLGDDGSPIVALDAVGAGAAEIVIFVRGREAAHAFHPDAVPADAGVIGIVDHVTIPH